MNKVFKKYTAMFNRPLDSVGKFETIEAFVNKAGASITADQLNEFEPAIEHYYKEILYARRKKLTWAIVLVLLSSLCIGIDFLVVWYLLHRNSYMANFGFRHPLGIIWTKDTESFITSIVFSIVILPSTLLFLTGYRKYKFRNVISQVEYTLERIRNLLSFIQNNVTIEEKKALNELGEKYFNLKVYQDVNIKHTKRIFYIGVSVIYVGIAIIIFTILVVFDIGKGTDGTNGADLSQVIAGIAGGVLVDGVGAVLIAMYTKISESAIKFQEGLLEINKAYLGNVFVSRINDEELRNQTLSDMAKALVKSNIG